MKSSDEDSAKTLASSIAKRLRGEFLSAKLGVLHEPYFGGNEGLYAQKCIETGFVSSVGEFVDQFEEKLSGLYEGRPVIATNTGTSALHLALLGAGVLPGDEVIVPAITFVATANAVSMCGAYPHFADVSPDTLALDSESLAEHLSRVAESRPSGLFNKQTGRKISAVVLVHIFGHGGPVQSLSDVVGPLGVPIVEDAAEAVGSRLHGRPVGVTSPLTVLSFNGNKIVTTGGGGAIVVEERVIAEKLRHLSTTAKVPHRWRYFHDMVGYNYRMPNINAAIGCAQLEQLEVFVATKRQLFHRYVRALGDLDGVEILEEPEGAESNYWLQALVLTEGTDLDTLLAELHQQGIGARPLWEPLHQLPMYRDCQRSELKVSEQIAKRIINLPSGVGISG